VDSGKYQRDEGAGAGDCGERVRSAGMSYWRWLLFSIMAQLELPEEAYLNIPNAVTTQRDVPIQTCTTHETVAD
jgi:hypothetical protein